MRLLTAALSLICVSGLVAQQLPAPVNQDAQPVKTVRAARFARGAHLREDGILVGQVDYIDQSTLELRPVNNAIVTLMQNRAVVAQKRSGPDGSFEIKGLSPSAVYSVFVYHPNWTASLSFVALPRNENAAKNAAAFKLPSAKSRTTLVSNANLQPAGDSSLNIQVAPREDFITALQSGILGSDVTGAAPGAAAGPGGAGAGAGAGSGGGGGGGGGGGDLGAIGAALGAAAIAAGLGDDDNVPFSSPFTP